MLANLFIFAATLPLLSAHISSTPVSSFVSHHKITTHKGVINYTATAEPAVLRNDRGQPMGEVFSFSYIRTPEVSKQRPVLFAFNGGPGSSSIWLHVGVVGPKKAVLNPAINPGVVPPFRVEDNPDTLLDVADLVFIDPIGTGFSRMVGVGTPQDFFGVDEDAESIAAFIEAWLTKHGRWNSPKFLMGESYGSARAALLPRALMGGPTYTGRMRGITINGIVLLGTTLRAHGGEDDRSELRTALALPSMAATAMYHGRVDSRGLSLREFEKRATAFALGPYLEALKKDKDTDRTTVVDHEKLREALSSWTGLPPVAFGDGIAITTALFSKTLLKHKGLNVGLYDSRYTLPALHDGDEPIADDPAMGQYVPAFIGAFHQLLREHLRVKVDRPYGAIVWRDLLQHWNWERQGVTSGQSFAVDLATAMRRNQKMQVLVAAGSYDLVTTAAEAQHDLEVAGVPKARLRIATFPSGHMLYIGESAAAFSDEVRKLILRAS